MSAQTALITGASTGIGHELARLFAAHKWRVILLARNLDRLSAAAERMRRDYGDLVETIAADLATPHAAAEISAELQRNGTRLTALVNNAGFGASDDFAELPLALQVEMIQTNVTSLVELTHTLLPDIISAKGYILNVASTAAFQPGPHMAIYYATKAFVLSFSEALAEELAKDGVTVSTLCPGPTRTAFQRRANMQDAPMFKGPFTMNAETVARAGFEGLMRGKRLIIPGFGNKFGVQSQRLAPRRLVTKIAGKLAEKK